MNSISADDEVPCFIASDQRERVFSRQFSVPSESPFSGMFCDPCYRPFTGTHVDDTEDPVVSARGRQADLGSVIPGTREDAGGFGASLSGVGSSLSWGPS